MTTLFPDLFPPDSWQAVSGSDPRALAIVDGTHPLAGGVPHYSRRESSVGSPHFTPNGREVVLLTVDEMSVWSVCENKVNGSAEVRWRCTCFRRLGGGRACDLIRSAVNSSREAWRRKYGALPAVPMTTEVDPAKVNRKRDPGRCFIKAGWFEIGMTESGLIRFQAPE